MNYVKKNKNCIIFCVLSVFISLFLISFNMGYDATWEYGMSHAIRNGLLPYKDFNTITTPLFIFVFSIGLFLFDNFLVFIIESIIIFTIMFYFYDKAFGDNSLLLVIVMGLSLFLAYIPSYNSFSFIIIVILLSLEKMKYNDKIIGFLIGLLILSKHTIGLFVMIFTLSFFIINKDRKRLFTRLIYIIIPIIFFTIYLLITNTLSNFLDLCFLGLFDFGNSNTSFSFITIISVVMFIINIIYIIKNKDNILFYYTLGSIMFVVPIFDASHFAYFFPIYMIPVIDKYLNKIKFKYSIYIFIIVLLGINYLLRIDNYKILVFPKNNHFKYSLVNKNIDLRSVLINKKMLKYDNYYLIDYSNMYYDISYDREITYFDVPLHGNFGYNGVDKMKKRLDNMHDCYFVFNEENYNEVVNGLSRKHFVFELVDYIYDDCRKVDSVGKFSICYKK